MDEENWDEVAQGWEVGRKGEYIVWVVPMMFSVAIIVGKADRLGYENRWCYHTAQQAFTAAEEWTGDYPDTEPRGWYRQPSTGRRRVDGDPAKEYINW
jgi:hypothetical protein